MSLLLSQTTLTHPDRLCRPANPILIAPHLYRALFPTPSTSSEVLVQPPPFGARRPTLPIARTITLARIATTEGVDKRYERSWLRELKAHFSRKHGEGEDSPKLIRRGDIISVPIRIGRPVESGDSSSSSASGGSDSDDEESSAIATSRRGRPGSAVAYFVVTALSYEPLVPLEEDFRSSVSSKARAGELGCWIDVGEQGSTKMVLTGVERARVTGRDRDRSWHNIRK